MKEQEKDRIDNYVRYQRRVICLAYVVIGIYQIRLVVAVIKVSLGALERLVGCASAAGTAASASAAPAA